MEEDEILKEKFTLLKTILKEFARKNPGIELAAIVSIEGLPICNYPEELPENLDDARIAAMTAALLSLGERAMLEVAQGELSRVLVEGNEGYLISVAAGTTAVLTVSAKKSLIKLGLLFHEMKQAANEIGKILG